MGKKLFEEHECACMLRHYSVISDSAILWTVACQAPLSMGFSKQKHWSGLPCPPPGDLPNLGVKCMSLKCPALAGMFFTINDTREAHLKSMANLKIEREKGWAKRRKRES